MARQEGETEKGKGPQHPMLPPAVPTPSPIPSHSIVPSPLSAGSGSPTEASTPKPQLVDLPPVPTQEIEGEAVPKADVEEVVRVQEESVMEETAKLA